MIQYKNLLRHTSIFAAVAITFLLSILPPNAYAEDLIDAVVAVVDGEPITITDLEQRIGHPLSHNLSTLASDQKAKEVLEGQIQERILENEARDRKLSVSTEELDKYILEVAERNHLTLPEFATALKKEGSSIEEFKIRTHSEILRTKLASSILSREIAISNEDVEKNLKDNADLYHTGPQIELAQIYINSNTQSAQDCADKLEQIKSALKDNPDAFAQLARQYSDAPEAQEGGALPLLAPEDLSPEILAAIADLKNGEISEVVSAADGHRIFRLIKRYTKKQRLHLIKNEIREKLRKEKISSSLQSFFMSDIYKKHSVDKKI